MKIAVIGAGASGLVAIKYCIQDGHECEAFEQTEYVGGTWNYTDDVGLDKNGLPIHTSMYKHLRTNLPKELMTFEDFPYPENLKQSYILQKEVLQYLNDYADQMNLRTCIRFLTHVTHVEPMDGNKWNIEIQDVISKKKETKTFDAVICCNGKYSVPYMPDIPGLDSFTGTCIHSHDYRSEESYRDRIVLVIGGGPSGTDICHHLTGVAKQVLCSLRNNLKIGFKFPGTTMRKSAVQSVHNNLIFFEDGSMEQGIDDIILCTGYDLCFPFLDASCGIVIQDNYIPSLYKEVINSHHPTMAILGIPSAICPIPTAEIQMRFFLAILNGQFTLPSKEKMLIDAEEFRLRRGVRNRLVHEKAAGNMEREYFDNFSETANIQPVPSVITDLHHRVKKNRNYNDCFKIIDGENFEEI